MKRINNGQIAIYLSIVFMSICLWSCSNDDDDNTDTASIIGVWERTKYECNDEDFEEGDDSAIQIEFKTNGTTTVLFPNGNSRTATYTYDYRNGYLYTDQDGDTTNRITTLTNTTLVLECSEDDFISRTTFKRIK